MTGRIIANEDVEEHAHQRRDDSRTNECSAPADIGAGKRQRRAGKHDTQHAEREHPAHDRAPALARIPVRAQDDGGHEAGSVTQAQQKARSRKPHARDDECMHQGAHDRQDRQAGHGEPRADAIEHDADRHLDGQQGQKKGGIGKAQRFRRQRQVANKLRCNHVRR